MVWEKSVTAEAETTPLFLLSVLALGFSTLEVWLSSLYATSTKEEKAPSFLPLPKDFSAIDDLQASFFRLFIALFDENRTSWFHKKLKTKTSLVYVISERQKNLVFPILVIFPPFPHFFDVHDFHARSFFTLEFFCHTFDKSLEYISVRYLLVFCHSQHGDSFVTDKNLHWQLFSDKKLS